MSRKNTLLTRTQAKAIAEEKKEIAAAAAAIRKPNDLEKKITELVDLVNNTFYEERNRLKFLAALGVGTQSTEGLYFTCHKCGRVLAKNSFYVSTEVGCESGRTPICKDCANDLAQPTVNGVKKNPTKESIISALDFLRKPYLDVVWDSSLLEAANTASGKTKNNVWTSYIKNIQLPNYYGLNYGSSDFFTGGQVSLDDVSNVSRDQEIIDMFEQNKSDALRLLGFLPFEQEKPIDQPFLYAQLIGYLDTSGNGNDDMLRVSSIISIVRGFLQFNRCDDMIAQLTQDSKNAQKNVATMKAYQEMKKNIASTITNLARESCISLKNTKDAKKGENTWTGKIKKIQELNLREGEVNGFDLLTCKGMQQVMELSDASIMKQLRLDESEWSDMVAEQREMIRSLQTKLDFYAEAARIMLKENLDLRTTLSEHDLLSADRLVDLDDLYSPLISDYMETLDEEGDNIGEEDIIEEVAEENYPAPQEDSFEYELPGTDVETLYFDTLETEEGGSDG